MHTLNQFSKTALCPHQLEKQKAGITLVTIGNPLRKDDAIGQIIAQELPTLVREELCCFDIESYSQFLLDCLAFHEIAVIVDATKYHGHAGEINIIDLGEVLENNKTLKVESCHGLSFVDELKMFKNNYQLPDKLYFFGIETKDTGWGEGLSKELEIDKAAICERLGNFLKSIFIKSGL